MAQSFNSDAAGTPLALCLEAPLEHGSTKGGSEVVGAVGWIKNRTYIQEVKVNLFNLAELLFYPNHDIFLRLTKGIIAKCYQTAVVTQCKWSRADE